MPRIPIALCLGATAWLAQDSPEASRPRELAYVQEPGAVLHSLPAPDGAPRLGELSPGTALRVHERRPGWARVSVQAWVRDEQLDARRPDPVAPAPEEPGPRQGLEHARRIRIAAELDPDGEALVALFSLEDDAGRPVVPAEGELDELRARLQVVEERQIAGGRVRGPVVLRQELRLELPQARRRLPLSDWAARPDRVRLVLRADHGGRSLGGTLHDLELKEEDEDDEPWEQLSRRDEPLHR